VALLLRALDGARKDTIRAAQFAQYRMQGIDKWQWLGRSAVYWLYVMLLAPHCDIK